MTVCYLSLSAQLTLKVSCFSEVIDQWLLDIYLARGPGVYWTIIVLQYFQLFFLWITATHIIYNVERIKLCSRLFDNSVIRSPSAIPFISSPVILNFKWLFFLYTFCTTWSEITKSNHLLIMFFLPIEAYSNDLFYLTIFLTNSGPNSLWEVGLCQITTRNMYFIKK